MKANVSTVILMVEKYFILSSEIQLFVNNLYCIPIAYWGVEKNSVQTMHFSCGNMRISWHREKRWVLRYAECKTKKVVSCCCKGIADVSFVRINWIDKALYCNNFLVPYTPFHFRSICGKNFSKNSRLYNIHSSCSFISFHVLSFLFPWATANFSY